MRTKWRRAIGLATAVAIATVYSGSSGAPMAGRVQLNEPAVPLRQATRLSLGEPTPPGPPTTAPTSATTSTTTVPPTTTTTVPPTTTTTTVPPTTTTTTTTTVPPTTTTTTVPPTTTTTTTTVPPTTTTTVPPTTTTTTTTVPPTTTTTVPTTTTTTTTVPPTTTTTTTTTVPPTTTTTVPPTTTTTTTTTTTVPTTTTTLPATSQEYLLVGDSLCVLSEADILIDAATAGILSELSIDCEGGRAPAAGVPIAVAHEPTPDVLMFELGTNPGDELQSMNAYDAVIGAFPHADIYFATGYREYPPGIQAGVDTLNDYMFVLAAAHDHVRVCDWAPVIQANTDWFVDSIHYDAEGEAEFAQFIVSCMLGDLHD